MLPLSAIVFDYSCQSSAEGPADLPHGCTWSFLMAMRVQGPSSGEVPERSQGPEDTMGYRNAGSSILGVDSRGGEFYLQTAAQLLCQG